MSQFSEKVAVYGTLRPGFGNYKNTGLNTQKHLGVFKTKPEYDLRCWTGCPGMYPNGDTSVVVSLFEVTNPSVFDRLDRLEGHRDGVKRGYHREKIEINGEQVWTYVYYGETPMGEKVEHGDWKLHKLGDYEE